MTVSSRFVKLLAAVGAVAAHGAVAMVLNLPDPIEVEGGAGSAEVQLGNGFADLAVGTMQAQAPDQAEQARPEETLTAAAPPETAPRAQATSTRAAAPDKAAQPAEPQKAAKPADTTSLRAPVEATRPTPDTATVAEAAQTDRAAVADVVSAPDAKPQTLSTRKPQVSSIPPEPERLTAEPEREKGPVTKSLRPRPRSPQVEQTARAAQPKPQPKTQPKPQRQTAKGNADRNMRAGDSAGTKTAKAQSKGTGGTAKAADNAAISNYPGQVMRKLSRAGKPRVNARGQAVVAFTVASNGGLQAVSLARSSGSSALDQAALRLVRSAAPFPQPPSGARRSFSIGIKGR